MSLLRLVKNNDLNSTKGFLSVILLGTVSFLAFVPVLTYFYFAQDLSAKERLMNRNNTGLILYDRNNKPFFKFNNAHTQDYIPLDQISAFVKQSVITAEDKDFYKHPGFSIKAIIGALAADIKHDSLSFGGSTITQQLVKNSLLSSKRNFLRKYQELFLAQEIEGKYSKDQILEMYLNSVYFGEGAFGIEDAAKTYFNKKARDLSLAESSLLSSLLPAPSKLSPLSGDLEKAKRHQEFVLSKMIEEKYITGLQKSQALAERLKLNTQPEIFSFKAPHFALMVKSQLEDKYGEERIARSGFKVKTTIDLDKQDFAQKLVADQVEKLKPNLVSNGAAVVIDPKTGQILALVGSKDWNNPEFGKVDITNFLRQPGSSFKPIVYSAGLQNQTITTATILKDEPQTFPEDNDYNSYSYKIGKNLYHPKDFDGKYRGPVTIRRALSNSLNIPSVEVLSKVGIPQALEMGRTLGLTTLKDPSNYGLSLTLGAAEVKLLELTNIYATFANQGLKNTPTAILEIDDKYDNKIYQYQKNPQQVLEPAVAFLISSILSDNKTRAETFGNTLNISRVAAVKTGTTENFKDALTLGYTPSLAVGVWVGNNDGAPMDQIAGSLGAAPIWKGLMEKFLAGTPEEKFEPPDGIVKVSTCTQINVQEKKGTSSAKIISQDEYFIAGTQPKQKCIAPSQNPSPSLSGSPNPTQAPTLPPPPAGGPQDGQTKVIIIPQTPKQTKLPEPSLKPQNNSPNEGKD